MSATKPIGSRRVRTRVTNYRRNFLLGGSYFFTVNLADRRLGLLVENIGLLRAAFRSVRERHSFTIDAALVLPDHLHMIWIMPDRDADFALRWRLIKSAFTGCPAAKRSPVAEAPKASAEFGSDDIGSTRCATKMILPAISITFTSTRQTRARSTGGGVGTFLISPLGPARGLSRRLGGRLRRGVAHLRRKVMGFASSTHPTPCFCITSPVVVESERAALCGATLCPWVAGTKPGHDDGWVKVSCASGTAGVCGRSLG